MKLIGIPYFFIVCIPMATILILTLELTDLIKKLFMYIFTQLLIYFLIALAVLCFIWAAVFLWIERIEFKRYKKKPELCRVADEILDMDITERFLIDRKGSLKVVRKRRSFFKKAV